jgi:hypothetical protein
MDGHFLLAKVDAERGRSAAPYISRAHKHKISQSFGLQVNVCGDLCYQCAFISHVWSPFHGCGASLQSSAWREDFMNPKHHMHMKRCFDIAGFIQKLWIGLLCWLSRYCWLCLRCSIPGLNHTHSNNRTTPSEISQSFFLPQCLPLPVGGSLRIQNIALDTDIFLDNSRHQNIEYDWIELYASWIQQKDTSNHAKPTCPHFFFSRPGSEFTQVFFLAMPPR